jgi:hypothetical protein
MGGSKAEELFGEDLVLDCLVLVKNEKFKEELR